MFALKVLDLDASNASAHNAPANIKVGYDRDWAGAESEYRRALEFNPGHLLARLSYAGYLSGRGRHDDGIAESERALALDPISPISLTTSGMPFFRPRRYDEAIRASQKALDLDPGWINALWWQGLSYAGNRDYVKSVACLTKAVGMSDGSLFRALLGHVYGRSGERTKALGMLAEIMSAII